MANVANLRINAVVVDQATPALKRINQALNGLNSGMSGTSGGALGAARAITGVGGGANMAAVGLGVAVAATAAFVAGTYQLVKASVSAAAEVEGYRNTFIRLTGDATKADAILSKLQDFADWSPFDDQAVMKSAQMLLGAGVQAEDLTRVMTGLSDISGDSAETFGRATLAFSQMLLKGKVSQEELNQFAEAGIPAQKMLADAMGVSTNALGQMASRGELVAKKVLPLLIDQIDKQFGGSTERASQSVTGLASTLDAKLNRSLVSIGKALEPLTKTFYKDLIQLTDDLSAGISALTASADFQDFLAAVGDSFAALGEMIMPVLTILGDLVTAVLPYLTAALQIISVAMRLFGAALQVVARFLKPVWDFLRIVGQQLKAAITWVSGFGVQLGQLGKWIMLTIEKFAAWVLDLPLVKDAIELVSGAAKWLWEKLKDLADGAWTLTLKGFDEAKRVAGEVYDAVKPFVERGIELAISVAQSAWDSLKRLGDSLKPIVSRAIDVTVSIAQSAWDELSRLAGMMPVDKIVKLSLELLDRGWQDIKAVWTWLSDKFPDNSWLATFKLLVPGYDAIVMVSGWVADNIEPLFTFVVKVFEPQWEAAKAVATWVSNHLTELFWFTIEVLLPGVSALGLIAKWVGEKLAPYFTVDLQIQISEAMLAGLKGAILAALGPIGLVIAAGEVLRGTTTAPSGPATVASPPPIGVNTYAPETILGGLLPGVSSGSGGDMTDLGHGCFTSDTRIWTAHGLMRISDVVVGDIVDVWDGSAVVQAPVSETHIHHGHAVWALRIQGDVCHTTAEHPWLTPTGWKRADELVTGSDVMTPNGVETVQESGAAGWTATVHNITVDHAAHTYLVGTARWIVHNKMALARGGIVTAPTMALIGERGPEAVIPLDQMSGGGPGGGGIDTVIINVSGFADGASAGRAAADAFRRQLGLQRRLPFGTA